MMRTRIANALLLGLLSTGCYHAVIETGLTPSTETIAQPWASGWIYGLVPPKPISAASKCSSGVARVETQLSFVNQLVSLLTLGIYTPMDIRVTCAASRAAIPGEASNLFGLNADARLETYQHVFAAAADAAVKSGGPAFVVFSQF